ncbi:hypothetical protein PM082_023191 [Marasmius tenuissimus]|nr:hypothetical protein PM082_023191 [Marasmius tenuissimus]
MKDGHSLYFLKFWVGRTARGIRSKYDSPRLSTIIMLWCVERESIRMVAFRRRCSTSNTFEHESRSRSWWPGRETKRDSSWFAETVPARNPLGLVLTALVQPPSSYTPGSSRDREEHFFYGVDGLLRQMLQLRLHECSMRPESDLSCYGDHLGKLTILKTTESHDIRSFNLPPGSESLRLGSTVTTSTKAALKASLSSRSTRTLHYTEALGLSLYLSRARRRTGRTKPSFLPTSDLTSQAVMGKRRPGQNSYCQGGGQLSRGKLNPTYTDGRKKCE